MKILHPVDGVKLRLYTGLSIEETAGLLRVSVERECTKARAWLLEIHLSPRTWL